AEDDDGHIRARFEVACGDELDGPTPSLHCLQDARVEGVTVWKIRVPGLPCRPSTICVAYSQCCAGISLHRRCCCDRARHPFPKSWEWMRVRGTGPRTHRTDPAEPATHSVAQIRCCQVKNCRRSGSIRGDSDGDLRV